MTITADEIRQLTESVWEASLGIPLGRDTRVAHAQPARATAACVQITGAWNGAVLLDCTEPVSRMAAASFFATEPQRVTAADMRESVAELANMLAGNLKALLPEQCYLSLPSVVDGADYSSRIPGSRPVMRLSFECAGHNIAVTIVESTRNTCTPFAAQPVAA